jgi:hypothetical protein
MWTELPWSLAGTWKRSLAINQGPGRRSLPWKGGGGENGRLSKRHTRFGLITLISPDDPSRISARCISKLFDLCIIHRRWLSKVGVSAIASLNLMYESRMQGLVKDDGHEVKERWASALFRGVHRSMQWNHHRRCHNTVRISECQRKCATMTD